MLIMMLWIAASVAGLLVLIGFGRLLESLLVERHELRSMSEAQLRQHIEWEKSEGRPENKFAAELKRRLHRGGCDGR